MYRFALHIIQITALLLFTSYLISFAEHTRQLFSFPFPLDYGEGPLITQVEQLRTGTPIWRLYADPSAPPFIIVNYPPVYLLLTALLAQVLASTLLAGRLIALLSTLGVVVALVVLAWQMAGSRRLETSSSPLAVLRSPLAAAALLFLTIPIVREWAVLMRVDMLGLCLGLWGLVALQRGGVRAIALAGLLILASLCTKPSLVAAPLAAGGWLLWRIVRSSGSLRRNTLMELIGFAGVVGLGGGLVIGVLQWASGGWFWLHVVAANANRWEAELAWSFWLAQAQLRWPLAVLAALAVWAVVQRGHGDTGTRGHGDTGTRGHGDTGTTDDGRRTLNAGRRTLNAGRRATDPPDRALSPYSVVPLSPCPDRLLLPLLYTLGGVLTAIGVGKVGAYSNYFLELYAGLVWLIVIGAQLYPLCVRQLRPTQWPIGLLLVAALALYPPLWDPDRLRPAGLIEPSPPRLALSGLWADARREAEVLSALTRVHTALAADVRAAGPLIFADLPGVAAAAGVGSRLQAFEARQLLDQGLADETALRRELANGELPLAVIDFLGNWLTPEVVALLQRRYAQDGAWGTFDMFRPVDPGPPIAIRAPWPAVGPITLNAYSLAAPLGSAYEPGELLTLALTFERPAPAVGPTPVTPTVEVRLYDSAGQVQFSAARPLLYGALPLDTWPADLPVEHLQPFSLPPNLPAGVYTLAVVVGEAGQKPGVPVNLTSLTVEPLGGRVFTETGHFVPAPLLERWAALGGNLRIGLPLTPLTPFAWGRLQCFEYACLEWRDQQVQLRNLGERLYLAETQRAPVCLNGLCPGFAPAPAQYSDLGTPISGVVQRNGWLVQWTTTARLERPPGDDTGLVGLGRLGDDTLRLPPGKPYRWP